VSTPTEARGFEPEILLLYCEGCVDKGVDLASASRHLPGCSARFVALPCSSKIEIRDLVKLLEQGADAVQVLGCADSSCKFLVGNSRAAKRVEYVRKLLEEIGFGPERVGMVRGTSLKVGELMEMVMECAERVRLLGPNPMKT